MTGVGVSAVSEENPETPDERMRRIITSPIVRKLPRRFYKSVEVSDTNAILLDGRPVKTPMKNALALPNRALAEAVAAEWVAQVKVIDPELMPITKLANTALDRATAEREHVLGEIVEYAGSDLVCYWTDRPPELVQLQRKHWQPVLDWANAELPAQFRNATSITHIAQDDASLVAVRKRAETLDNWQLTGVYILMTLMGSSLLALRLQAGGDADAAWAAAHVDEDYQISQWGEDSEAILRRAGRRREFDGLVQFFELLRGTADAGNS
jgi:chaperone required for assembly of F1-ATPase